MIVVLTGGIASGKTAVSDEMADLGADVVDADVVARQVVAKGGPVLVELVAEFGHHILTQEGDLDRGKLKQIAFSDPEKIQRLNAITHPAIRHRIRELAAATQKPLCVVVIPLVQTKEQVSWADRVLVVDTDPETQLKRVMQRDSLNRDLAEKIFSAQTDRKRRLALADDVINNRLDLPALKRAAGVMFGFYSQYA